MLFRVAAQFALAMAQSTPFTIGLGYLAFRTAWVAAPAMLGMLFLMTIRCRHCRSRFVDDRILQRLSVWKFFDTRILDECPVCSHPMLGAGSTH